MLSNINDRFRSYRSVKSLKNFYAGDTASLHSKSEETHTDLSINELPSTIHLPPSITSTDKLSPKLWNWILSSSFNSKLIHNSIPNPSIAGVSYAGQEFKPFPPPHLVKHEKVLGGEGKISSSSTISSGGNKRSSAGRYDIRHR
jgi:hypothetical protein